MRYGKSVQGPQKLEIWLYAVLKSQMPSRYSNKSKTVYLSTYQLGGPFPMKFFQGYHHCPQTLRLCIRFIVRPTVVMEA